MIKKGQSKAKDDAERGEGEKEIIME